MQKNLEFPNSIKKKERIGVFMLLKLKIYYKTIAIKTVWYQHKVSHINQQNRLESPVRASHIYGQLILIARYLHQFSPLRGLNLLDISLSPFKNYVKL